jgi:PAS domain S-box-containing protein
VESDLSPQRNTQGSHDDLSTDDYHAQAYKERFTLAVHGSADGWWDRDLRASTTYFSPRWKEMLGYAEDEISDQLEEWIKRVHVDDLEGFVKVTLQQQINGEIDWHEFDHRVLHKDGSYRWIHARGSALHDEHGRVYRMAGWHTDITVHKQEVETQKRHAQHANFRMEVSIALAEHTTLPKILQRCTQAMVQHLHAAFARIWTLEQGENVLVLQASAGKYTHLDGPHSRIALGAFKIGRIAQARRPHLTNDVLNDTEISNQAWARAEGMISFAGYPLVMENRVVGVMAMFSQQPLMEDTLDALATVANAIAQGIGRKWAEEYQELAILQERQRLARELHDSVSQALYGIVLGMRSARVLLLRDPEALKELLDHLGEQAETGLTEMRTLIFELRPETLEREGLVMALRKQAEFMQTHYGLILEMEMGEEPQQPFIAKEALYRIAQEALHNIVKHASTNLATLHLHENQENARLVLEISDKGTGFNPEQSFPGHLGLQSMRERLERLGGTLNIISAPGQGTQIRAMLL